MLDIFQIQILVRLRFSSTKCFFSNTLFGKFLVRFCWKYNLLDLIHTIFHTQVKAGWHHIDICKNLLHLRTFTARQLYFSSNHIASYAYFAEEEMLDRPLFLYWETWAYCSALSPCTDQLWRSGGSHWCPGCASVLNIWLLLSWIDQLDTYSC